MRTRMERRGKMGTMMDGMKKLGMAALLMLAVSGSARADDCITQSAMKPADRDALATAARGLAAKVQAGDVAGLRGATVAEYAKDFGGIEYVVGSTAPKLKGGSLVVQQVYLLDGTQLKRGADGAAPDAQFFCSLNHSMAEADFLIPGLAPGSYGFAIVEVQGIVSPWRLSFLVRKEQGQWQMAGFYPTPLSAAGHDGIWYWKEARAMAARKEQWNAWLYYQQAESLLRPTSFIQSTHLEKLKTEQSGATPPAVSEGLSKDAPLVVKGADGAEYRFVGMGVDDSLGKDKIDIMAHLKIDQPGDAATTHKLSAGAASALLGAYPEMRKPFHGVWIVAEVAGQSPFATEFPVNEIH